MRSFLKNFIPDFILTIYREHSRKRKIIKYRGNRVFCPVCQSTFREFAPYGLIPRANAECVACGVLERHRLIWLYLHERQKVFTTGVKIRLLHVGPQEGFYKRFSEDPDIEYTPCDLSPDLYPFGRLAKIQKADLTCLPFKDNFFDAVICNHVLEHIPDDRHALSEIFRVMKKEAWAILQVPIDQAREKTYEDFSITTRKAREKAFGQYDHVRVYGRDYKEKLEDTGFQVTEDDYAKSFSPEELFHYGLINSEIIYFCIKN